MTLKFDSIFRNTEKQVDSLIQHVEQMALIADRQSHMVGLTKYYNALALQADSKSLSTPFHTIPVPRNTRFFGRTDILQDIDEYFSSSSPLSGIHSLAIYGLGGVGKTQSALEYAWKKHEVLDVVLWVPAENEITIQQALSHVALTVLKLTGADPTSHKQNAVLVMQWLSTTGKLLPDFISISCFHSVCSSWCISLLFVLTNSIYHLFTICCMTPTQEVRRRNVF
jgi:hypothetical protein